MVFFYYLPQCQFFFIFLACAWPVIDKILVERGEVPRSDCGLGSCFFFRFGNALIDTARKSLPLSLPLPLRLSLPKSIFWAPSAAAKKKYLAYKLLILCICNYITREVCSFFFQLKIIAKEKIEC